LSRNSVGSEIDSTLQNDDDHSIAQPSSLAQVDDFLQPMSFQELMQSLGKSTLSCPRSHSFWREIEQLYFLQCDLENIVDFYEERLVCFWGQELSMTNSDPQFMRGAIMLKSHLQFQEKELLATGKKMLKWFQTRIDFPFPEIAQVEQAFILRKHVNSDMLE
jgi:hypothetical protein